LYHRNFRIKVLIGLTILLVNLSLLYGQTNFSYTGIQAYKNRITLDTVTLEYEGSRLSWFFTSGGYSYGYFGLGIAKHNLSTDLPNSTDLSTDNQFTWNFQTTQVQRLFYGTVGINFFNISGDIEVQDGSDSYIHKNVYQLIEFPIGYGIQMNLGQVLLLAGYKYYYYYGRHHEKIYLLQDDKKIKIDDIKTSFDDESVKYLEAGIHLFLSKSLYFHVGFTFDPDSKDKSSNMIIGFNF